MSSSFVRRRARSLAYILGVLVVVSEAAAQTPRHALPPRYVSAAVDADGVLRIATADGRVIHPTPLKGQHGSERVRVAPDRRSVGWLALFPNPGGASYPIPLSLAIYTNGRTREISGDGLMGEGPPSVSRFVQSKRLRFWPGRRKVRRSRVPKKRLPYGG